MALLPGSVRGKGRSGRSPSPCGPLARPTSGAASQRPASGRERRLSPSPVPSPRPCTEPAKPQDITQVFRRFDVNGDGKINHRELTAVLQALDPVLWNNRTTALLLMSIDKNFDGFIDYSEFVEWVSADGTDQNQFRRASGMPRTRAEIEKLAKDREEAANKGTIQELNQLRAIAVHRQEVVKNAEAVRDAARERYDKGKAEAEVASKIYMPMYDRFKEASSDGFVPAKELFAHDAKEVSKVVELKDPAGQIISTSYVPPVEVQLTVQGLCILLNAHPGTKPGAEPDYWNAFLDAVVSPKLLFQMETYDKETISPDTATQLRELCNDALLIPERVRECTKQMGRSGDFLVVICLWLHFLTLYHKAGVKKLWDEVRRAEIEMNKEEGIYTHKVDELEDARKKILRLETQLNETKNLLELETRVEKIKHGV